jgi:hypothetical protein
LLLLFELFEIRVVVVDVVIGPGVSKSGFCGFATGGPCVDVVVVVVLFMLLLLLFDELLFFFFFFPNKLPMPPMMAGAALKAIGTALLRIRQ